MISMPVAQKSGTSDPVRLAYKTFWELCHKNINNRETQNCSIRSLVSHVVIVMLFPVSTSSRCSSRLSHLMSQITSLNVSYTSFTSLSLPPLFISSARDSFMFHFLSSCYIISYESHIKSLIVKSEQLSDSTSSWQRTHLTRQQRTTSTNDDDNNNNERRDDRLARCQDYKIIKSMFAIRVVEEAEHQIHGSDTHKRDIQHGHWFLCQHDKGFRWEEYTLRDWSLQVCQSEICHDDEWHRVLGCHVSHRERHFPDVVETTAGSEVFHHFHPTSLSLPITFIGKRSSSES